jgi:hypothetical protein
VMTKTLVLKMIATQFVVVLIPLSTVTMRMLVPMMTVTHLLDVSTLESPAAMLTPVLSILVIKKLDANILM